jgi:hypothetical protein
MEILGCDRQLDDEFRSLILLCVNANLPAMCFHNIITQAQPQPRTLACGFGGTGALEDNLFFRFPR